MDNYYIKIDEGYFHSEHRWVKVEKAQAESFTWDQAMKHRQELRKLGYATRVERMMTKEEIHVSD